MAKKYGLDVKLSTMETIGHLSPLMENTNDLLLELIPLKSAYPNLHKAVNSIVNLCEYSTM